MKGSKLVDIFKQGSIVIPMYLIQNIKKFNLKMNDFVFLMYLYNLGDRFLFNPNKFSEDFGITLEESLSYISSLNDKHLIRVEVNSNDKGLMEEYVVLEDFYNKLSLITMEDVNEASSIDNTNIYELIEREFGRTLSPMEYEIIKAWVDEGFSSDLIKEAIKEATLNNVFNLRYIDKILFEWGKAGIKTVDDVNKNRKKRNNKKDEKVDNNVDLDMVDWDWMDDDE